MSEEFKMMTVKEMNEIIEKFGRAIPEFSEEAHRVNVSMKETAESIDRLEKELRKNGFMDTDVLDCIRFQHALILKIMDRVIDIDLGGQKKDDSEEHVIVNDESDAGTVIIINIRSGDE